MSYAEPNSKFCRFCRQSLAESWTFEPKDLPLYFQQNFGVKKCFKTFQVRLDQCANQADFPGYQAADDDAIVGNLDPVTRFFSLSQRKQPPVASA